MLIVSHLARTYSMSAVNIVAQVGQVVIGVAFGFLSGTTVIVAQYLGAGQKEKEQKAIETPFAFIFGLSVIATVVLLLLTDPLLKLMERAMKATKLEFIYSAVYSVVICMIMWIFSKELMMIFTYDPQTLAVGANYFKGDWKRSALSKE